MLALLPLFKGSSVYVLVILLNSHCSEYLVRFAVRHESRRVLHGDTSPSCPFRCHRLDDSSHCYKCKAQRDQVIHRDHESLFWVQWARCCVIFPVLFRIRWCVSVCYDALSTMFSFNDRDVRLWNHHRCVFVVFGCHSYADICSQGIQFPM